MQRACPAVPFHGNLYLRGPEHAAGRPHPGRAWGDPRIPKAPPPSLGLVLTILRWNAGWRQGELAEALGISPSELSAYENGKALSRERLDELLVPLGVTPDAVDFAIFFVEILRQEATEPPGSPFALGAGE